MALHTGLLTSIHGHMLGLTGKGRLYSQKRDQVFGGLLYSNVAASTAISNVTAETAFSTKYTIPANFLSVGQLLRIRFQGIATATHSTDTLAIKLYLGGLTGTALLTMAATNATDNDIFTGEMDVLIRTIGASGTFVAVGTSPSVESAQASAVLAKSLGSTAIDTTVAQDISVSATWSVADVGNSCRLDYLTVIGY